MNPSATLSSTLLAKFPVLEKVKALPKPVLLGAAAALVALIAAAVMWSSEPQYKVLFSNLDDRDGGAIVTALGQMNVPYKYNENGTALLVPADRVYDARLQLASQGLPRGGTVGKIDTGQHGARRFERAAVIRLDIAAMHRQTLRQQQAHDRLAECRRTPRHRGDSAGKYEGDSRHFGGPPPSLRPISAVPCRRATKIDSRFD